MGEAAYRIRLSESHLADAEEVYRRKDHSGTVASSQLCVENSAKAVIAFFRILSWSHDLSQELWELLDRIPEDGGASPRSSRICPWP
ncbi:MAG: HEPN domain-containing protein [Candidatus Bathyarchaeia archaeon]